MKKKTVWTGTLHTKTYVLNNSPELRAERFDVADILNLAGCKQIRSLTLCNSKGSATLDLSLLAHIDGLEILNLEKVNYHNMAALAKLPSLEYLEIENCKCFRFSDLDNLNQIRSFALYDYTIETIPDGFGNSQMASLERISLRGNCLKSFPSNLNLKRVRGLDIWRNELSDTSFLTSYPKLEDLDLSYNRIKSLVGLTEDLSIETLELYGNPVEDISPATSLSELKRLRIPCGLSEQAGLLGLPIDDVYPKNIDSKRYLEAKSIIENLERKEYHQLTINDDVRRAISRAFNQENEDVIELLLSHPDQNVYECVIQKGVYSISSRQIKLFEEKCLEETGRLVPALTSAFLYYFENLDHWSLSGGPFFKGRFKDVHIKILSIAMRISGPQCGELFKLYLIDYNNFSVLHETAYKKLFGVIGKTKNPQLTDYVIRTMQCEKHILGGDAAFVKKALNAVKSLGNQSHLDYLKDTWRSLEESREDVVKVYNATTKVLGKRVAK